MSAVRFACQHRYRSGFALDLIFEAGEGITALFGPSGSGKTTVLEMIAGFRSADQATIHVAGDVLVDTARGVNLRPEQRRVALVAQDQLLFPHLTVKDNLRFGTRRRGAIGNGDGKGVDAERVIRVLELADLLERKPVQLSGGQRQRVALGRAVLSSPRLLLLDEALAALDVSLKDRILRYLERVLNEWKLPTLFVTHSQEDVRRLASAVVVIDAGRVVAQGNVETALAQPAPLAWSDATGPMNLLRVDDWRQVDGRPMASIGEQQLQLPAAPEQAGETLVAFSPRDVILARTDLAGMSVRNHLRGRVTQLIELAQGVFVEVDVGQRLWAEITPDAMRELGLERGASVVCLVKTHSLRIVR
jgi:molybdate transport system ATP-binding protein